MCYWGSPMLDVAYLLFTSSTVDVTASEWNALIEYYIDELVSAFDLLELTANRPSKDELRQQFRNRAVVGAAFSLFTIPLRMLEKPQENPVAKFLNDSDENRQYRRKIYSDANTLKMLKNLLLFFDEKNLLD